MRKMENGEKLKKLTPYEIVANLSFLLILDGIFGLVMRIMYMASEGIYFSTIVMAISSIFLLLSGIIGKKVQEEHEKLNMCSILFVICVITYVISLVFMGMEGVDFEEMLSGIMVTIFLFLLWGVIIARAYIFKRKGNSDEGKAEDEA